MALKKTTFKVELLYDTDDIEQEVVEQMQLGEVACQMTDGPISGEIQDTKTVTLTKKQMEVALKNQGSDPAFLLGEDYK